MPVDDLFNGRGYVGRLADIAIEKLGGTPVTFHLAPGGFHTLPVYIQQDNGCTLFPWPLGNGFANSEGCADYDCHLILKAEASA